MLCVWRNVVALRESLDHCLQETLDVRHPIMAEAHALGLRGQALPRRDNPLGAQKARPHREQPWHKRTIVNCKETAVTSKARAMILQPRSGIEPGTRGQTQQVHGTPAAQGHAGPQAPGT